MRSGTATRHPMRRLLSKRRGLLAGVATLVAGALHRGGTEVAYAAPLHGDSNSDTAAVSGENTASSSAAMGVYGLASAVTGATTGVYGRVVSSTDEASAVRGEAVISTGQTYGVVGSTLSSTLNASGVKGVSFDGVTNGVWGQNASNAVNATGVFGQARAPRTANVGVWGRSESTDAGAIGVYGHVNAAGAAGTGVYGQSVAGIGVQGTSTSGIGVYGESTNSYGCGGATSTPGYAGLFGYATVASAAGFLGVNAAPGGTAGYFHGNVTVDGGLQVVNGPKNALVVHPDGSLRKMYCQESPEPWFEDFGQAQLRGGKATVRLDPDFAAVVKTDDYEVFPVPKGECKGLYVANQTPTSFEVRELQGGSSSTPFSYRLVARRKDDVGRRMEKVDLPRFDLRPPGPPATPPGQDRQPRR